jgi:DNA-binding transcriptional ArsR family regulator
LSPSAPTSEQLAEISRFFRLLGEPARLQLICALRSSPSDVQTLIEKTGFSQSHISRQLSQLSQAGLVRSERQGQRLVFYADDPLVGDLCSLVSQRLRETLEDKLETFKT